MSLLFFICLTLVEAHCLLRPCILARCEPYGQHHERGALMALVVLFEDLQANNRFRTKFNRPARRGKRWTFEERTRWVYPNANTRGGAYLVGYKVEVFKEVDLPADNPKIEWDL
jgi:hypothetical protein